MTLELRSTMLKPELRAGDSGKVAKGYAALFGSTADIGDMFEEVIAPGAFSDTLNDDVRALVNHDRSRVIGRTKSGTLRLKEDTKGLYVEIDLPDTTDGRDLAVQLERGDVSGMSFGFSVTHDEWDETGAKPIRTIHKVVLYEVSATAFPAYSDTEIALRSLEEARAEQKRQNFSAAAKRLRMKATLDLRERDGSKA